MDARLNYSTQACIHLKSAVMQPQPRMLIRADQNTCTADRSLTEHRRHQHTHNHKKGTAVAVLARVMAGHRACRFWKGHVCCGMHAGHTNEAAIAHCNTKRKAPQIMEYNDPFASPIT